MNESQQYNSQLMYDHESDGRSKQGGMEWKKNKSIPFLLDLRHILIYYHAIINNCNLCLSHVEP